MNVHRRRRDVSVSCAAARRERLCAAGCGRAWLKGAKATNQERKKINMERINKISIRGCFFMARKISPRVVSHAFFPRGTFFFFFQISKHGIRDRIRGVYEYSILVCLFILFYHRLHSHSLWNSFKLSTWAISPQGNPPLDRRNRRRRVHYLRRYGYLDFDRCTHDDQQ